MPDMILLVPFILAILCVLWSKAPEPLRRSLSAYAAWAFLIWFSWALLNQIAQGLPAQPPLSSHSSVWSKDRFFVA